MGVLQLVGLVLLVVLVAGLLAAAGYCFYCTHYWQQDAAKTVKAGFTEKQATLPGGAVLHYAEGPANGTALLLVHGQTGAWQDYQKVLPALSRHWHVFAVDCYGHGGSSHDAALYSIKANGDDLVWFVQHIIGKHTVVSGHSSGGLLAAYVAANGGELVTGAVLEDPPVFSTERGFFETSFAYMDTYAVLHDYLTAAPGECWEAYYLRHCLWGRLFMPKAMPGLANYAQKYHDRHPGKPVQFFFLPPSLNAMFLFWPQYDLAFGERFYDYTWHSGIAHEELLAQISVPTVFLHAKDQYTADGILMAASADGQARRAVELLAQGTLIELQSNHDIHRTHPKVFLDAVERLRRAPL